MPTYLEESKRRLHRQIDLLSGAFLRRVAEPPRFRIDRFSLQEGLVSSLWQAWNLFCREAIIQSAVGAVTSTGAATISSLRGRNASEVAYCARELAQGRPVAQVKALSTLRQEPTWGDVSKAVQIVTGLGCSNQSSLATGLAGTVSIRDLQTCRNACAHINSETLNEVAKCRVRYAASSFRHPSDMIVWVDPNSSDFLWMLWCEDLKVASEIAIQ